MRKSNSATRLLLTLCTFQQHVESHLGKNQTQPKILMAFLFSSQLLINVTLICMSFFTAAILLCAVRDAQCRTSECSRARKKSRAVVPGTSRFSCWARKLPIWMQEVTPVQENVRAACPYIGQAWIYPFDKTAGIFK